MFITLIPYTLRFHSISIIVDARIGGKHASGEFGQYAGQYAGVDVNAKEPHSDRTAMHKAAIFGHSHVIESDMKANINAQDDYVGRYALARCGQARTRVGGASLAEGRFRPRYCQSRAQARGRLGQGQRQRCCDYHAGVDLDACHSEIKLNLDWTVGLHFI
jgi:hypothetical protein